jgi:hypothetical protein
MIRVARHSASQHSILESFMLTVAYKPFMLNVMSKELQLYKHGTFYTRNFSQFLEQGI